MDELTAGFQAREHYLWVQVSGPWQQEQMIAVIDQIAQQARATERQKVLVDAIGLSAPAMEIHRYFVGEHISEVWGPLYLKVAVVAQAELINYFVQTVARNRGANLLVTSDMDEARTWLGLLPSKPAA